MNRHSSRWLIVFCFIIGLAPSSVASNSTLTPAQVVFHWMRSFPQDLPKAATLTTTTMRDGLSPKDWVEKNAPLLKDLQFKYLEWKILDEDRDEMTASVSVKARLYLVIGEVRQVETYLLKKVKGHWRIDSLEIEGDHAIGRTV